MLLKRILVIAPILLALALLQSYFWVPTYDAQSRGNPGRLVTFIEGSIGDAKILNPILNADASSARITGLVFDGLLDLDKNLNLRGRLATDWSITESAYLTVIEGARFPDGAKVTPARLQARITAAVAAGARLKQLVAGVALLPRQERSITLTLPGKPARSAMLRVHLPARLEFKLRQVDQDFFKRLQPVLGAGYEQAARRDRWVEVAPPELRAAVEPRLADLAPVFEHNPEILFHLRHGVRFHDGREFTAKDVKFTYEAIMNPKNLSPRTSDFEPIKSVDVLDRYAVRVVYKRLFSPAIDAWTMGILPEHLLNADALAAEAKRRGLSAAARESFGMRDSEFNRHPIGTGPFKFGEWRSDEYIHLARNDDYWEGAPEYHDFYYRIIPDPLTQEVEFRTGAVDAYGPLPHQAARYQHDPRYQSFSSLGFAYTYIGYNLDNPLFADRRVRRALGMAIDVDEIIKYVLYGQGERTTGPYPKNTDWYDPSVKPLPYDPAAALRILQSVGWKRNADGWLEKGGKIFEFNLITNNGNPLRKAIMTIAQNSWRRIGIKCNTQVFEWAVFLGDFIDTRKFDAVVLGWSMGIDPDLYQIWHSSQTGPNQLNFVGYRSAEADELIVRIRREYDVARQRELTRELHRLIAADQPYTFLYAPRGTTVLDKKIVVVKDDGSYTPIEPARSGDIYYDFNRWRKLAFTPRF
jgi:peptide/nickel transport system substrate-binding protein